MSHAPHSVMPARTEILWQLAACFWIPACAGMTKDMGTFLRQLPDFRLRGHDVITAFFSRAVCRAQIVLAIARLFPYDARRCVAAVMVCQALVNMFPGL